MHVNVYYLVLGVQQVEEEGHGIGFYHCLSLRGGAGGNVGQGPRGLKL